jgi:thiol-disulfide isomerase/thioredoxin
MSTPATHFAAVLTCLALLLSASCTSSSGAAFGDDNAKAPEFPPGLDWLNVDHPLTLQSLRGKVVVLDFWTFCCINCMHIIPDLHRLESKYGDSLVVIGVHSAKFVTEKGTDNIRQAVLRYGVTHPVVNDHDFQIWTSFGVNAWPTLVLIDPDGNVAASHGGEGAFDAFDQPISDLIHQFDAKGKINRTPIALHLEKDKAPPSPLQFPGKLIAVAGKLYVSDSSHNRIVILNESDGSIADVIGSGSPGLKDGSFADTQFLRPQGLALNGQTLYVADTENHAIRTVDLASHRVTTLAGTGVEATQFNVPGQGTQVSLNSPWDLVYRDGTLFIAMAGMHQLWTLDTATRLAAPYAGSAAENIADGPLPQAALAQPSGLTTDGTRLYSADSETSSIREIDLDPAGSVNTIVGHGLFDFGDADGPRNAVLLQHPLGVLYHDGLLYVADTYNNKIKTIDPKTGTARTLIGTGKAGFADGPALSSTLNEPGGLAFDNGKLFIADTNNHLIRVFDPPTGTVSTLKIAGAEKLLEPPTPTPFTGTAITLAPQRIAPGAGRITVNVTVPKGYALNAAAPFFIGASVDDSKIAQIPADWTAKNIANPAFPLTLPATLNEGGAHLTIDLIVYYCESEHESVCLVKRLRYVVPLEITPLTAVNAVNVDVNLTNPPR